MKRSTTLLAAVIVLMAAVASFFRYNVVTGGRGAVYVLDRWTGSIRLCYGKKCSAVPDEQPARIMTDDEFLGAPKRSDQ
jgi:hypothetical protein